MDDAPIEIAVYDDSWPLKFEIERSLLEVALAPWLVGTIEHIGSTAVANLPAKPVIDIMAPVRSLQVSRPAIEAAAALGYVYYPYKSEVMHWFCKPSPAHRYSSLAFSAARKRTVASATCISRRIAPQPVARRGVCEFEEVFVREISL